MFWRRKKMLFLLGVFEIVSDVASLVKRKPPHWLKLFNMSGIVRDEEEEVRVICNVSSLLFLFRPRKFNNFFCALQLDGGGGVKEIVAWSKCNMQQWGVGRLNVFEISHWFSPVYNIHLITFTECVSLLSWTNQDIPRHFIYNVFIFKLKIAPTPPLYTANEAICVIWLQVNSNCIQVQYCLEIVSERKAMSKPACCGFILKVAVFLRERIYLREKKNSIRFPCTEGAKNRKSA